MNSLVRRSTSVVAAVASLLLVSCDETVGPASQGLLRLSPGTHLSVADGATIITIVAAASVPDVGQGSVVTFTTTSGQLSGAAQTVAVPIDSLGIARAQLRAPSDSAIAYITATMGQQVLADSIVFVRARADLLVVTVDRVVVKMSETVKVTATPSRQSGTVSGGQLVTFFAHDTGAALTARGPILPTTKSLAQGAAADATFFPDVTRPVWIGARMLGADGKMLADSILVQVIP